MEKKDNLLGSNPSAPFTDFVALSELLKSISFQFPCELMEHIIKIPPRGLLIEYDKVHNYFIVMGTKKILNKLWLGIE